MTNTFVFHKVVSISVHLEAYSEDPLVDSGTMTRKKEAENYGFVCIG